MFVLILLLVAYVVSVWICRNTTIKYYAEEYEVMEPDNEDFLICFIPIVNLWYALKYWTKLDSTKLTDKFFNKKGEK